MTKFVIMKKRFKMNRPWGQQVSIYDLDPSVLPNKLGPDGDHKTSLM